MTIEEKAAAYDLVSKQRDAYIFILANLLDKIYTGCMNNWDLTEDGKARDAKHAENHGIKFNMNTSDHISDWELNAKDFGLFHLTQLLRTAEWADIEINKSKWDTAELVELLKKANPEKIIEHMKELQNISDKKPENIKKLVMQLFIWVNECPISESLPSEERSIYQDMIRIIVRQLMLYVDVDPTDKQQVIDALHEADPNLTLVED